LKIMTVVGLGSALGLGACTGLVGRGRGGGGSGDGTPGDITGPRTEPLCASPATPRPVYLRRLSNAEYSRTVSDLLGVTVDAERRFALPSDTAAGGFRNNAENGTISTAHVERYGDAAAELVSDLMAAPARRTMVAGCDMAAGDRAACLDSFLKSFGRRAYRRPLRADEVSGLTTLAGTVSAASTDPWAGFAAALEAMLQSSDFLYRIEMGEADPDRPGVVKLGGFELATRLSYLVWGTTPDDDLLDSAAAGGLDTPEGLRGHASQMLADARARRSMQDFYLQWLQIDRLDRLTPNTATFPAWNDTLKASMRQETIQFTDDLVWRDGASFMDLLGGRHTFADATLAGFYGLPPPSGSGFERVDLDAAFPRGGFLTQASFLAVTSKPERTSPTLRGRYIREALLCEDLPDPPPDVDTTLPPDPGLSLRERLEQHSADPGCAGCHAYMDPVGLAFEQYDGIGAFRATDAAGEPISTAGRLVGFTPEEVDGPHDVAARILATTAFPRCTAIHLFRYAFARRETADDRCSTDRFYVSFRDSGYSLREMLTALVESDAFRYRLMTTTQNGGTP
jgi:hypothetical protein